MIDTDKYEGHTRGPWEQYDDGYIIGDELYIARMQWEHKGTLRIERDNMEADAQLIADAPLLLAEVIRLRERHVAFMQWMIENHDEIVNEWEASE